MRPLNTKLQGDQPPEDAALCSEFFDGSPLVTKLEKSSFDNFVNQFDVSLVMFFHPCDSDSKLSKHHIEQAARKTKRANHAYGAVNCFKQPDVCAKEGITTIPSFRIYSKGNVIGTFLDFYNMTGSILRSYVEGCGVVNEPVKPNSKGK